MTKLAATVTFDFEFTNADGEEDIRELTMKSARLAPGSVLEKFIEFGEAVALVDMFRWAMSPEDYNDWLMKIPYDMDLNWKPLYDAWQQASRVDVGKSEASSTS